MLQIFRLVISSRHFLSFNISRQTFHHLKIVDSGDKIASGYIHCYMKGLAQMETISLIQSTQLYTYQKNHKGESWCA